MVVHQPWEAKGASILWRRSLELHNMRYKWMVSDGDSKVFSTVENVYDDCHVQKRMGKHLLNLKARTKRKAGGWQTHRGAWQAH